ncbi:hypothetical protein GCK72_021574 [Caenorhabditis remanei]|uniref:Uncharacterized protein n=1 Tax=Caenorhabditis remanei TaxID=31234 RepID=A0A6A5GIJ0_CAERE|nr:hypothetical protein GCK72_021574 [Caenorhabditis remanei]KAF1755007.1 hypothetical protein GCK72_021574 [Caenorhabditis remanei]
MMEDYTIVTEDTKSYMDNLLEQFLQDDTVQRIHPGSSTSPSPAPILHTQPTVAAATGQPQSRADSEIDEVIRSLKKETAQNGVPVSEQQPDQDLRKLLGMDDGQCEEVIATVSTGGGAIIGGAEPIQQQPQQQIMMNPDEEKQVTSSSGSAKKRKMEEALMMKPMEMPPGLNSGKFPMSILSAIRRPPPPQLHTPHHLPHHPHHLLSAAATSSPPTVLPPTVLLNQPMIQQGGVPAIPAKYNAQAVQILDFEAKVLYNQSLHSTIAREDAMCTYYRMKSRKMELEIKKLERELGEEQDDPQDE